MRDAFLQYASGLVGLRDAAHADPLRARQFAKYIRQVSAELDEENPGLDIYGLSAIHSAVATFMENVANHALAEGE